METETAAVTTDDEIARLDAHWRAANYLSVGQIYLLDNPLLRQPLTAGDIKPRLLGHWGTCPGLTLVSTHLARVIAARDREVVMVAGPGHGGPALLAASWLDGSYTAHFPDVTRDAAGLAKLFRQFSFPGGVPSHASPTTPGSLHEGGELGYALAHAVGAALDAPERVVACVIGDGEAETGALAASWGSTAFLEAGSDGAVLPILHLNGYKIANPTLLARIGDDRLGSILRGHGWEPLLVEGDDPAAVHSTMAATLDAALDRIVEIQHRGRPLSTTERWPMIVLRTPKGWTGPDEVDGTPVEGTWRAHQVPLASVRDDADHRCRLEQWMRSYRPEELFDDDGCPRDHVVGWLPSGDRRLGAAPAANGGRLLVPLALDDPADHGVVVDEPGASTSEPTRVLGGYLASVFAANAHRRNMRLVGPDETASNRLDAVYEVTAKDWQLPMVDTDVDLARDGRVMEVLSEHLCQGWLEGYLRTGRHGLFSTYEAFVHIVDSMFNQHAKWLQESRAIPWRAPIASLNYLLTSHVWRQDHNGFSHQDPGFLDVVVNKKAEVVRVYLPPDANTLLAVAAQCLASRDLVNVVVSGKQPTPNWLSPDDARLHCDRGLGIWDWAGTATGEPDVVLACAGDVPTVEAVAAASILADRLPDVAVRVVNVVDLMRLQDDRAHPHGLPDAEFDAIFTHDRPVIFAFHGYPWLIHRLAYRRRNHPNLHVRGYIEEGSTTTPFDMVSRNCLDRYHLVMDVIDRTPGLGVRAASVRQEMVDRRAHAARWARTHGVDPDEVADWRWEPPS